jgi:dephospho-CoA kinase
MAADSMEAGRIGVAGFMGAGKSTCAAAIARYFKVRSKQALIIDADAHAKRLMQNSAMMQIALAEIFGKNIIVHDAIEFKRLGRAAFTSAETLKALNRIVHPRLVEDLKKMVFSDEGPLIIVDAALIPLWRVEPWFNRLIWVGAAFEKRLDRLCKKTVLSKTELVRRMQLQEELFSEPEEDWWTIVKNEGSLAELENSLRRVFGP